MTSTQHNEKEIAMIEAVLDSPHGLPNNKIAEMLHRLETLKDLRDENS
jgi:hypothetical protein